MSVAQLKDTTITGNLAVSGTSNLTGAIQSQGDITLYTSSGDSPKIIFQRGTLGDTLNDYQIYDTGGHIVIKQQGNSGTSGFTEVARITNTGVLSVSTPPATSTSTPSVSASISPTDSNIKIATDATIASGDKLVIRDTSASNAMRSSSISFGSSTTQFLANNGTWQIPAGGTTTDVQVNGTSITSGGVANLITNTAYNSSTNKIATMADVDVLTITYTLISGTDYEMTIGSANNSTILSQEY